MTRYLLITCSSNLVKYSIVWLVKVVYPDIIIWGRMEWSRWEGSTEVVISVIEYKGEKKTEEWIEDKTKSCIGL